MTTIPTLQTERLILRPPSAADRDLYVRFFDCAEASALYGGPLKPHEAWRILAQDLGHWHLKGFGKWTLQRRADGALIGGCGLVHLEGWPSHELTWWLLPEHRGSGFATEASHEVIAYAYDTLHWSHVETHMRDENASAHAIAKRLRGVFDRRSTFPDGFTRDVFRLPHPAMSEAS
ncbi:MAG: GNAT family N-acetyltransferase [Paracoccaceae bacterium]